MKDKVSSDLIRTAIIDETDMIQARGMLDDQSEKMIAFMSNSAVLAWLKDEQGRYVFLSDNFRKRFPFSIERIRGKTDFEMWTEEVAKTLRDHDDQVRESGKPLEVLEKVIGPDGSSVVVV